MQNNKSIAIIGAMDCEIELIKNYLSDIQTVQDKCYTVYLGKVKNNTILLAKSGVGKVAAAGCTQYLADKFNPDCILNTGVAGGVGEGLKIGDVVIADTLIQHDFNVTALGYAKGYVCNGINSDKPTIFEADKNIINNLYNAAQKIMPKENIHIGRIVSGDTFIADADTKKEIKNQFNALATEMESAAIAHCATLNNIPFCAIRAISDLADGSKIENYPEFEIKTAQMSANLMKTFLAEL